MNIYKFHWRDGQISQGPGSDVADAFRKLGYGGGAIAALDRYEVVEVTGPDEGRDVGEDEK